MQVILNGVPTELPDSITTLSSLLTVHQLNPKTVIVEKNGDLFKDGQFDTPISPEDVIEIVHFMGGG